MKLEVVRVLGAWLQYFTPSLSAFFLIVRSRNEGFEGFEDA
jgi:hypothetical protein